MGAAGPGDGGVRVRGFVTEAGEALGGPAGVPVAFSTFGKLAPGGANCVVVGHSLTSNASVSEWWAEMLGRNAPGGKEAAGGGGDAFCLDTAPGGDFVVCVNYLGSPYGTASSLTPDPFKVAAGRRGARAAYAGDFPRPVTIRDNVRLQRLVLEALGVRRVRLAIGGSMGGMLALEWAATFPEFVRSMGLICTCGRHTDWAIGLGEAQRHAIYADKRWQGGNYSATDPPAQGLATSRMMAMLSYRAPASVDSRFGRSVMGADAKGRMGARAAQRTASAPSLSPPPAEKRARTETDGRGCGRESEVPSVAAATAAETTAPCGGNSGGCDSDGQNCFAVESYLRYQGKKFIRRFDANCYVNLTHSLDTHDVARGRGNYAEVLRSLTHPTLVVGVDSDVLYPIFLQKELAEALPGAAPLVEISSPHGHDSFLIEIAQLNRVVRAWRAGLDVDQEVHADGGPLPALSLPEDLARCKVSEPVYGNDIDMSEYITEPPSAPHGGTGVPAATTGPTPSAEGALGVQREGDRSPTVIIDSRILPTSEACTSGASEAVVRAIGDLRAADWAVFIGSSGSSPRVTKSPEDTASHVRDLLLWSEENLGPDFARSNVLWAPPGCPVSADVVITPRSSDNLGESWPHSRVQLADPGPGKWLAKIGGHRPSLKPKMPWGVSQLVPANPAPSPAPKRRQFTPCFGILEAPTQRGAAAF